MGGNHGSSTEDLGFLTFLGGVGEKEHLFLSGKICLFSVHLENIQFPALEPELFVSERIPYIFKSSSLTLCETLLGTVGDRKMNKVFLPSESM